MTGSTGMVNAGTRTMGPGDMLNARGGMTGVGGGANAMLSGGAGITGGGDWGTGAAGGPRAGLLDPRLYSMGFGGDRLLTDSSFDTNHETRGGILSFWGRGAWSRFTGRESRLRLDGDVRTTMVGADYAKGPLVMGLSLSNSRSMGEYAGVAGGQVASSVIGLYPWLGYRATDRVTVWGVAGYGAGGMLLTPEDGPALEAELSMAMAAAGTRASWWPTGSAASGWRSRPTRCGSVQAPMAWTVRRVGWRRPRWR